MKRSLILPITTLMLTVAACGVNIFPIGQDSSLGAQMDTEIRQNRKEYPILDNEYVRNYVQTMVDRLVQSPEVKYRSTFPYKVTIINDDKTINAFATPGGYIYVYTGLLRYLENEAALAGVLAHEIAHAEERHGTEHMTQQLGLEVALSMALGENPSQVEQIVASSAALLAILKNSRDDEREADAQGFAYMKSTQWWPGGIKLFFEKMLREKQRGSSVFETWLSTHPAPEERVENINAMLKDQKIAAPTPDNLKTQEYRTMLRNLR